MREYNDLELNYIYLYLRRGYWLGGYICYSLVWDIFLVYWKLDFIIMEVIGFLDLICYIFFLFFLELFLCKS